MSTPSFAIWVVAPPGFEEVVADEVRELAARPVHLRPGGVELDGSLVDAAGLVLWSRTAARVLVQLAEIPAASAQQVRAEAGRVPWNLVLHRGQRYSVKASLNESKIQRIDTVEHHVEMAIKDAMRGPHLGEGARLPELLVRVRVQGKTARISVDAGGMLHQRGYRLATAKAPIRENLAAAVLLAAGWKPGEPLADPVCGSGTFIIEAAGMAAGRAPGLHIDPVIRHAPTFPKKVWEAMLKEARAAEEPAVGAFFGADRDPGAIRATTENAQRAGILPALRLSCKAIDEPWPAAMPPRGLVVMNPPYGVRVSVNAEMGGLYRIIGRALAAQHAGWRLAVLTPDRTLAARLMPKPEQVARFSNGGIPVSLWVGEIPGGT